MNYDRALELKKQIGDTYVIEGIKYHVFVAPSKYSELQKFIALFNTGELRDEMALFFSDDDEFDVVGLHNFSGTVYHLVLNNIKKSSYSLSAC